MIFKLEVLNCIKKIPKGKVVSYGQIAAAIGNPRAARQVGWVLRSTDGNNNLPWWRVINNQGILSIKGNWTSTKQLQKELLEQEGIIVSKDYKIDIESFHYKFK